jgi:hypothetical protein
MVLKRDQAEATVMKNLNLGYPAFMVQGYVSKIVQGLYGNGYGLALTPIEAGYQAIPLKAAAKIVLVAVHGAGLDPKGFETKISDGVASMSLKGYVFVKRVA